MASLDAMQNLNRDRDLMALMFANSGRIDPMAFAFANALQVNIDQ